MPNWTQHDAKLGKQPDAQLAADLGVNRSTVKRRREKLGIAAYAPGTNGDAGKLAWVSVDKLRPWADNPRDNDGRPVDTVLGLFKRLGHGAPIVAANGEISAGHTRLKAADALIAEWEAKTKPEQRQLLADADAWVKAGRPDDDTRPEWHPQALRIAIKREVVVWARDDWSEGDSHFNALADNRSGEQASWSSGLPDLLTDYEPPDLHIAGWNDIELAGILTPSETNDSGGDGDNDGVGSTERTHTCPECGHVFSTKDPE